MITQFLIGPFVFLLENFNEKRSVFTLHKSTFQSMGIVHTHETTMTESNIRKSHKNIKKCNNLQLDVFDQSLHFLQS